MIRTLNFTGRKKIPKDAVQIYLRKRDDGSTCFDAELTLDELQLPEDAVIYIEAFFKRTFMRFRWGTVGAPLPAVDRALSRLSQPGLACFRVKVTDESQRALGLLLAVCDRIVPEGVLEGSASRAPLFRVNYTPDLVDEIWRLNFDDDGGPLLELQSMPGIKEIVRKEAFGALVFPQVIRMIFQQIFDRECVDDPMFEPEQWPARWLTFGAQLAKRTHPPLAPEEKRCAEHDEWIDAVVSAWSRKNKFVANFRKQVVDQESGS